MSWLTMFRMCDFAYKVDAQLRRIRYGPTEVCARAIVRLISQTIWCCSHARCFSDSRCFHDKEHNYLRRACLGPKPFCPGDEDHFVWHDRHLAAMTLMSGSECSSPAQLHVLDFFTAWTFIGQRSLKGYGETADTRPRPRGAAVGFAGGSINHS